MEKHLLSKSTFIRGNQCLKSLYLNKKRSFLRDRIPKERLLVFRRGHKVGELAQQLFPGGIDMSPGHPAAFKQSIINTQEKIREGFPVIYEAAFQYDQVMIFLDFLVHTGTGWHAYEVKSSGGISDTYLMDVALQYHVIKGTGLDISGISLVHINKEYILEDKIDPRGLFKIVDITDEALSRQEYVKEQINREKEALGMDHSPKIDVGPHCREPYDCDFIMHFWKNIPKPTKKDAAEQIDPATYKKISTEFSDGFAFVKLLPMRPAIPMYKGTHPYQDISYGYCIMGHAGKEIEIHIFGHDSNPEEELLEALRSDLQDFSKIISFGQGHKLNSVFKDDKEVLDLQSLILSDSEFFTEMKDKSDLERLKIIFGLEKDEKLPEYQSDSIAEHYYLEEYPNAVIRNNLEEYAQSWVGSMNELFRFIHGKL